MSRPDLWSWNATRVEIEHRSREARLRLEQLERLLIIRILPTRSWVSRLPYPRGLRLFNGGRVPSRSSKMDPAGARRGEVRHFPTAIGGRTTRWALIA